MWFDSMTLDGIMLKITNFGYVFERDISLLIYPIIVCIIELIQTE